MKKNYLNAGPYTLHIENDFEVSLKTEKRNYIMACVLGWVICINSIYLTSKKWDFGTYENQFPKASALYSEISSIIIWPEGLGSKFNFGPPEFSDKIPSRSIFDYVRGL